MIRGKQILLTGGAGFIGTALATRLVEHNRIVVFDNGHRNSIRDTPLLSHPNLRYIDGDVLDAPAVRKAIEGCSLVVHLAAIAGVDTVLTMPVHTMKVSLIGTYHVLEAALATRGIERVIDFSTSEVFGTYAY
jgi:nucleoside-diphosphate-sugar epimerase